MFSDGYNEYMIEEDSDADEAESSEDEIQQWLTGTPEMRRKIRRRSLGQASSSEDEFEKEMNKELNDTMSKIETKRKSDTGCPKNMIVSPSSSSEQPATDQQKQFYSKEYFDSDEEDDSSSNHQHQVLTNDDLLYDPNMDDEDQKWVDEQRRSHLPKSTSKRGKKPVHNSDGVLDCPACMTTLCLDCQRHEIYKEQYRAMFVMNCKVNFSERLKYPKQENKKSGKRKRKHQSDETQMEADSTSVVDCEKAYHPVCCSECNTEVGVYDEDEVYHFFNVLVSYG